jgi:membrane protease YdiL (CAAX protease family)
MNDINALIPEIEKPVAEKRVWGFWATTGYGAVVMVAFIIIQVLVVLIYGFAIAFPQLQQTSGTLQLDEALNKVIDILNANMGLIQSIATIASGIICTGLIILFIKARKRAGIKEYLGLNKINWKAVLLALGVVIGFIVLSSVLLNMLGKSTNEGIETDIYTTSIWPPLFWIAVVIFAPLFEEALFRGFLFEGFRQSRLGPIGAILLTALGWALIHSLQYQIISIAWIFFLGIVMGIVRLKTRSIWSTFIMHALVNIIATAEVALKLSIFIR